MNKFDIIKFIAKAPAPTPTQELVNIATLIAATCLASKVESIIIELAKEANNNMIGNIEIKEVE